MLFWADYSQINLRFEMRKEKNRMWLHYYCYGLEAASLNWVLSLASLPKLCMLFPDFKLHGS